MSKEFSASDSKNKTGIFIKGAIIGIVVALVSMLIFSALILFLNLDRAYAAPFATVSVAAGSLAASYYTAKKIGDKGYLIGIIVGISVFLLITILSLIINRSGLSSNTAFHFIIIMLASVVGGIMGVNKDKNKKYI